MFSSKEDTKIKISILLFLPLMSNSMKPNNVPARIMYSFDLDVSSIESIYEDRWITNPNLFGGQHHRWIELLCDASQCLFECSRLTASFPSCPHDWHPRSWCSTCLSVGTVSRDENTGQHGEEPGERAAGLAVARDTEEKNRRCKVHRTRAEQRQWRPQEWWRPTIVGTGFSLSWGTDRSNKPRLVCSYC
jgi:hypothetical protein